MIASICGPVVHGKGLGRRYGMPTANIDCSAEHLRHGVYGGIARLKEKEYLCVVNIGTRPSVDDDPEVTVEAFLLDFNGDLYNQTLHVDLLIYVREVKRFDSFEALRTQVDRDIETVRRHCPDILCL